jgi:hypothetical protein
MAETASPNLWGDTGIVPLDGTHSVSSMILNLEPRADPVQYRTAGPRANMGSPKSQKRRLISTSASKERRGLMARTSRCPLKLNQEALNMNWGNLSLVGFVLVLLIIMPLASGPILRAAWKHEKLKNKPRRRLADTTVFSMWAVGVFAAAMILESCGAPGSLITTTMPAFPWPPPAASAETSIPDRWLPVKGEADLATVASTLELALRQANYRKWSYSSVPNGFALVSQMEQIKADGTPSPEPARWSADLPRVSKMTLLEFIRALVSAQPGFYRVIVFIVTDQPWPRMAEEPTGREAHEWLTKGFVWLPKSIGKLPYGLDYRTTALVYEFRKDSKDAEATLVAPSQTTADDHIRKAGISEWLSRH